jgi:HPt (histidine-containing phosphotransfer) domain-containing protein
VRLAIPEALHARFLERMAERVVTLRGTATDLERGAEPRASLERQLHSIAGIAGTYGLDALTELARDAEERCRAGASAEEVRGAVAQVIAAAPQPPR